jgi:hypothetical protein
MSAIRDGLEDACRETTEIICAYMARRIAAEQFTPCGGAALTAARDRCAFAAQLLDEIMRGEHWPPGEPDFK